MQIDEFSIFLKELCTYYERKVVPTVHATSIWYKRVKFMDSKALETVKFKIFENSEGFPKNIPNVMWEYYREWKGSLAQETVKEYKPCSSCNGEGEIFLQKQHPSGQHYTNYVFRCDQCKQCKSSYPWGNKLFLINRDGYREHQIAIGAEKITGPKELRAFINSFGELPF